MMYLNIVAALVVALVITAISVALGRRGPWGSVWTFFLVMFLSLWIVAIYIRASGPVYFGIAWTPIFVAGILFALLLAAALPDANHWRDEILRDSDTGKVVELNNEPNLSIKPLGKFFWVLIILMVVAIIVGMINPQAAL
jgi:hypothetical protein